MRKAGRTFDRAADPAGFAELMTDQQLCLTLQIASSAVNRIYRGLLAPLGLTHPQYLVLITLWERTERASMGDLRRTLFMDTGAVTPLVKRMEAAGLLKRVRDSDDQRRVFVDLTEAGWALRDKVLAARREVIERLPMTGEELASLRGKLRTLNTALLATERVR